MKKVIILISLFFMSSWALKDYYRHHYLFDGERTPTAVTISGELDINTPENFSVRIGGAPLVVFDDQQHNTISIGAGYIYSGLNDLSTTDYTPNQLQKINFNFFATGDWKNDVWWIAYLQYSLSADTLFNSYVFTNSNVSYLTTVGYKANDRFTFGLSLVGNVGPESLFKIYPIPVVRAAIVPLKLWVSIGPLPEISIKCRATKWFLTSAGFKLGGENWYTSVNNQRELFKQDINTFWISSDFKIKGLVWAFLEADFPVSNKYGYRNEEYRQNGTVILRAGIHIAPDWKGFAEKN